MTSRKWSDSMASLQPYLVSSAHIDCCHPTVMHQAAVLAEGCTNDLETAQRCFEFVRDQIRHSSDFKLNPVTCKASDVLQYGTGYCYAKSHLLAALLRANGIPAGLCYQRLLMEPESRRYALHGLNAVFLKEHGWYRLDPRGNKPGVAAGFCPPVEKLAFPITHAGEADLPEIWTAPLEVVVEALQKYSTWDEVFQHLPDVELATGKSNCNTGLVA